MIALYSPNTNNVTSSLKQVSADIAILTFPSSFTAIMLISYLLLISSFPTVFPIHSFGTSTSKIAKWATIRYTDDHILDYMEVDASHAIFEVEIPYEWIGKTIGELDIRKKHNINILAVKNEGGEISVAISADTVLNDGSTLLVLGDYKTIQKCFHI